MIEHLIGYAIITTEHSCLNEIAQRLTSTLCLCIIVQFLEEQEELVRQREQEEKILAAKQAVRRYERANVRENIRDKYKLTKGS